MELKYYIYVYTHTHTQTQKSSINLIESAFYIRVLFSWSMPCVQIVAMYCTL